MRHVADVIEGFELTPIKTEYRGNLFRSRLEARWALFLDLIGVRWEYEPEGFELPSGRYLPDFSIWLGDDQCWLEVKPTIPTFEERAKIEDLARASGMRALITIGTPDNDEPASGIEAFFVAGTQDGEAYVTQDMPYQFCRCPKCHRVGVEFEGRGARICGLGCCPSSDRCHTAEDFADAARQAKVRSFWR